MFARFLLHNLISPHAPQEADHAARMAHFAAACVDAAATTAVREDVLAADRVQIRVGLHSGPATAVVIGSKNPKYTLLGDTINTARWQPAHAYHISYVFLHHSTEHHTVTGSKPNHA